MRVREVNEKLSFRHPCGNVRNVQVARGSNERSAGPSGGKSKTEERSAHQRSSSVLSYTPGMILAISTFLRFTSFPPASTEPPRARAK